MKQVLFLGLLLASALAVPRDYQVGTGDTDGDGIRDYEDSDRDGDGVHNDKDFDDDADGVADRYDVDHGLGDVDDGVRRAYYGHDAGFNEYRPPSYDGHYDGGAGDIDGDGIADRDDTDRDGDGAVNSRDDDDDGDGVKDRYDADGGIGDVDDGLKKANYHDTASGFRGGYRYRPYRNGQRAHPRRPVHDYRNYDQPDNYEYQRPAYSERYSSGYGAHQRKPVRDYNDYDRPTRYEHQPRAYRSRYRYEAPTYEHDKVTYTSPHYKPSYHYDYLSETPRVDAYYSDYRVPRSRYSQDRRYGYF